MDKRKGYNNNKYLNSFDLETIEDKGRSRFIQQPSSEISIELLKNKLRINELR